jgi:putative hemolysin
LLERSQDVLAALVLGNSTSNALLVALALSTSVGGGWSVAAVSLGVATLTLFVCEVAPKALGVRQPDRWALRVARPLFWFVAATRPVRQIAQRTVAGLLDVLTPKAVRPAAAISDAEYDDLVELAHQQGTLAATEKEILLQILGLDRRTVRDVMRPRAEMVMLPDDLPPEEMLTIARKVGHHRLPLYDESPDTIVGILNTRAMLLDPSIDLWEAIEFPSFVPESMNLLRLFEALQRQQRGLAIVVDEFGGVAGMVTLEDILSQVVGEIRAEGEAEGFVSERLGPGRWRASGAMRLEDLRREHPGLGEVVDVDTVGGLVVKLAEVVPPVGAVFQYRGLRWTVRMADERRVREVLIEVGTGGGTT